MGLWWVPVVILILAGAGFAAFHYWGRDRQKKKTAEEIAKERTKDAEVAAKPFVDNPTDSMRSKD